jgi:F-type H+-transporting ATPase subunit epsilon
MAERHTLHAEVLTPEGAVFSGDVTQLSTRTRVGEIGILANHIPVIARLLPTELRLHLDESEVKRYAQAEGWLEVFANNALVLVGEAIEPDQLDEAELRSRLEDAEARMSDAERGSETYRRAERDKRRAETFLAVASGGD